MLKIALMLSQVVCISILGFCLLFIDQAMAASAEGLTSQEYGLEEAAQQSILALNKGMFGFYDSSLKEFQKKLLAESPVILGLFSGSGGRFILYRPDQKPLEAPSVPLTYQLAKSLGHSSMAIYAILSPYVKNSRADQSWKEGLISYRKSIVLAKSQMQNLAVSNSIRTVFENVLQTNLAFINRCLDSDEFSLGDIETFGKQIKPLVKQLVNIAATVQADHWVLVLTKWKQILGKDWDKTYAVSNTLYVTRTNNILFTILAQFMGTKTINHRLLLIETTQFTTTPEDLLNLLSRILNDRALGKAYFNNYMLMDVELLGSAAHRAIEKAIIRQGGHPAMPEIAAFNSNEWPWRTSSSYGDGPGTMEEVDDEVQEEGKNGSR